MTEAGVAAARGLLAELAAAEQAYLATSPYRLVHENDMRAERYLVRVQVAAPVPAEVPQLAHAVARSLRTALDELATRLAGKPIRFPIYESLALFAQRSRKAIASMSDEAQATLEALQPYHTIGGFRNGAALDAPAARGGRSAAALGGLSPQRDDGSEHPAKDDDHRGTFHRDGTVH